MRQLKTLLLLKKRQQKNRQNKYSPTFLFQSILWDSIGCFFYFCHKATQKCPVSFGKEKQAEMKKYLIVGLGNIGEEYDDTRHNIGFDALNAFAHKRTIKFEEVRLGSMAKVRHKGRLLHLLKPSTFMNLSGKAVRYWMTQEKIPLENILVITDDLNLPFGTLRLKTKGSDGGHNGLKDIQAQLNTVRYPRLRFGIHSENKTPNTVDFVLGRWTPSETEKLPERLLQIENIILSFCTQGSANTMNAFNGQ